MSLRPIRIPPAILALLLQFAAFVLALLVVRLSGLQPTPLAFALFWRTGRHTQPYRRLGVLVAIDSVRFRSCTGVDAGTQYPARLLSGRLPRLVAVYWSTFRTQVPLYLSCNKVWQALESRLPADQPFSLIDLGSGIGGVFTYLAQNRPLGRYHGIESAPLPFLWSWLRIRFGGHRECSVHWGSFWEHDLSRYDVVFAYPRLCR